MVDRQHPLGSGQVPEREAGARLGGGSFETDRELEINSQLQVDIEEFRAVLQGTKVGTQVAYVEPPQDRPLQLRSALQAGFVNIGMVPEVLDSTGEAAVAVEQRGCLGDGSPAVAVELCVQSEVHSDRLTPVVGGSLAGPRSGDHERGAGGRARPEAVVDADVRRMAHTEQVGSEN